jgi:hypothetical protein
LPSVPEEPLTGSAEPRYVRDGSSSNDTAGAVFFRGKLWKRGHDYLKVSHLGKFDVFLSF